MRKYFWNAGGLCITQFKFKYKDLQIYIYIYKKDLRESFKQILGFFEMWKP